MSKLPVVPRSFLSEQGHALQKSIEGEMGAMQEELNIADERRESVYKCTRQIFRSVAKVMFEMSIGNFDNVASTIEETSVGVSGALALIENNDHQTKREGNLSSAIESFVETRLYHQFFLTGKLLPQSEVLPCSDEEYLSATLGFAQHLARYCVGRACEEDVESISICRSIANELMEKMLEFDFRNGPVRRKYDGLKYALRKLENITYEMKLLEPVTEDQPPTKRSKHEEEESPSVSCLDSVCFDEIKVRLDKYDKLREEVIKGSRDVQKLSKQSIFSVHRNKLTDAKKQLDQAAAAAVPLHAIVAEHGQLRGGAFANSLEEWAEAAMTLHWVEQGQILSSESMKHMDIRTYEYIGALSDFTGEIGRLAVVAAGNRDMTTVRNILNCIIVISAGMMQINVSGKFNKKMEAVTGTLKKLEDVVYELSLVTRGGRADREKPKDMEVSGTGDEE